MATTTEFPGECQTNTYILQDFGELAYIICSVSIPPSNNQTIQLPTPENNVARLRRTELQFRQASILAMIDPDTSQLFTFYKKLDVLKDQKSLLKKFGDILRGNSCTIAYKAAARVLDLFKPENAKLHRLFLSAILASIKILPSQGRRSLSLGPRYHAIEHPAADTYGDTTDSLWSLTRVDLQIIPTGHVGISVVSARNLQLKTLANTDFELLNNSGVVLAPGGQVAFYRTDRSRNDTGPGLPPIPEGHIRSLWQDAVTAWLGAAGVLADVAQEIRWVDLLLPVFQYTTKTTAEESSPRLAVEVDRQTRYKAILWPSHLCFVQGSIPASEMYPSTGEEDPLKFVEDWMNKSAAGEIENLQAQSQDTNDEDMSLFDEADPFSAMDTYQSFGPPVFPASQMVYPTPPDAVMTHATPGMSSLDGIAATPVTILNRPNEHNQHQQDIEMMGLEFSQGGGVGSGFYDEDLFEEMPGGTFDDTADAGAEPNWDFFDKADMDVEQPQLRTSSSTASSSGRTDEPSSSSEGSPLKNDPPTRLKAHSPDSVNATARAQANANASDNLPEADQHPSIVNRLPITGAARNVDTRRYSRTGQFWFNPKTKLINEGMNGPNDVALSPSSTSATFESCITEDDSSDCAPQQDTTKAPLWHRYESSNAIDNGPETTIDLGPVKEDIKLSLEMLRNRTSGPHLENFFLLKDTEPVKDSLSAELRLMLAQVFVDQVTQASLLAGYCPPSTLDPLPFNHEVALDLGQITDIVEYATVSQLTSITPPVPGRQSTGKIDRLADKLITMKRSDSFVVAATTILPFWDTLDLQPVAMPKDITAFCLCPPGAGYLDGCTSFLARVADAYTSCGLGNHEIGHLPDVTTRGLVETGQDPMHVARRFVDALLHSQDLTGTIVLYIISKNRDSRQYFGCCKYFVSLFKYYQNNASTQQNPFELVLQIIPADFLVSNDIIVVPAQREYNNLAFEIYGRIPPTSDDTVPTCELPVILADDSERTLKFSLSSQPTSPASASESVLHLAYAYSDDQRWIVACWSDVLGRKALTMTYQLRLRHEGKPRSREDVMKEMWEISQDIMKPIRRRWKLMVARHGFYEAVELNAWMHLVNGESKSQYAQLQLLSVECRPNMTFCEAPTSVKPAQPAPLPQHMYGTPASTPQAASITSPDNFVPATPTPGGSNLMNASTPPEHGFDASVDSDLTLVNPIEESWAVILPFGTNQSVNMLDIRPALTSGYLLKRLSTKTEHEISALGVHLIHTPQSATISPGHREELLEEILDHYRGLMTLAAARSCIGEGGALLPWHIHTSVAGASVLGKSL